MNEWNQFFIMLKPLLSILLFVTSFDNISYLSRNIFLNAFEMGWCLILSKILKAYGVVLVSSLLTLNIFNTLF